MDPETRSQLETRAQIIQNRLMTFCQEQAEVHRVANESTKEEYLLDCFDKMSKTVRQEERFFKDNQENLT